MDETTFSFAAADGTDDRGLPLDRRRPAAEGDRADRPRHGRARGSVPAAGRSPHRAGYVVYANDHRGHGKHGRLGRPPRRSRPRGLGRAGRATWVSSAPSPAASTPASRSSSSATAWVRSPLQGYLLDHSADLDAAVLSGTSALDVIAPAIDPTKEVDLSAFNAPFEPARTEYDWLSRDPTRSTPTSPTRRAGSV